MVDRGRLLYRENGEFITVKDMIMELREDNIPVYNWIMYFDYACGYTDTIHKGIFFTIADTKDRVLIFLEQFFYERSLEYTPISYDLPNICSIENLEPELQEEALNSISIQDSVFVNLGVITDSKRASIPIANSLSITEVKDAGLQVQEHSYIPLTAEELGFMSNKFADDKLIELLFPNSLIREDKNKLDSVHTYLLIDAAMYSEQKRYIVQDLDSSNLKWCCLYKDEAAVTMENVAPYLVDLTLLDYKASSFISMHKRFFKTLLDKSVGIIIQSTKSLDDLAKHLRKFIMIKKNYEEYIYFRFYDPRFCEHIIKQFTKEQLAYFFRDIESIFIFDINKELKELKFISNSETKSSANFDSVYETLPKAMESKFCASIISFLRLHIEIDKSFDIEGFVADVLAKSTSIFFKQEDSIFYYAYICFISKEEDRYIDIAESNIKERFLELVNDSSTVREN